MPLSQSVATYSPMRSTMAHSYIPPRMTLTQFVVLAEEAGWIVDRDDLELALKRRRKQEGRRVHAAWSKRPETMI